MQVWSPRGRLATTAAALATVAMAGCDWPSGPKDYPDIPVRGRVTLGSGDPVPNALIVVTARTGDCGGLVWATVSTNTNANGDYATHFEEPEGRFEGCLLVSAGSQYGTGGATRPNVVLTAEGIVVDIVIGGSTGN